MGSIERIPDESALIYLEPVLRLYRRQFDRAVRSLIADACEAIASLEAGYPEPVDWTPPYVFQDGLLRVPNR